MFSPAMPSGYEARKCRYRVASFCRGIGLDLSAEKEKITKHAIALYELGNHPSVRIDLTSNDSLRIFGENFFDFVFDCHHLTQFKCFEAPLREWWRVLSVGGHLVLYEKDKDYYPLAGTPGADTLHKSDLYWQDVWKVLKSFGNAELVSSSRHNDSNEYSWQLVVKKKFALAKTPVEVLNPILRFGKCAFPRKKKSTKEALVIRYGALGDTIWVTPVLKRLKEEGYRVVFNTTEYSAQVLKECPYIDEYIVHEEGTDVPYEELDAYWEVIGKDFEKVINLTKSVEGALVKVEGGEEFFWPHEQRHAQCNYNFQDRTMEVAGYPDAKGCLPELHFTELEETLARNFLELKKDKFVIIWGLAGSAFHKVYPWAEYIAMELAKRYRDNMEIITVGDDTCKMLEWHNPITTNKAGVWTVRQSFLMTKHANLVIGPDTGLMNAASCFDTNKIVLMSTNSIENLTKYWKNTTALWADDCECYPCHRLIYSNSCPRGTITGVAPKCMENIKPEMVLAAIEKVYFEWKNQRMLRVNSDRAIAFTIADSPLTYRLAKRVETSFKRFHPDIEFRIIDPKDEKQLFGYVKPAAQAIPSFAIRPKLCKLLLENYERVIYIDADCVVAGRLNEFLDGSYDVAVTMNIDFGEQNYYNAGVSAVRNIQFCEEWTQLMYKPDSGKSNQVYFNQLTNTGRYDVKVVDKENVYYNETSRPYWKEIELKDDHLWVNGRQIKILHWAGGVGRMENKLSSGDFTAPVRHFLNTVTETTDFTDIQGQEVSKWDMSQIRPI